MNPLKEKQVKQLEALSCSDLARKVNELVRYINTQCFFGKEMTVNVCNGKEKTAKYGTGTYGICDCPEPCQLHPKEEMYCSHCGDETKWKMRKDGMLSCDKCQTKEETKSWEEEFDEKYDFVGKDILEYQKVFIRNLLKSERKKTIKEIKEHLFPAGGVIDVDSFPEKVNNYLNSI